uniref:Uncharacterized protein n=1 Tax=Rhizophagus irregularis (strain DAOM 181602 / DAOM 197198 / MUCL 43194) TaxID=747089 RepID=U9U5T3_RHIID
MLFLRLLHIDKKLADESIMIQLSKFHIIEDDENFNDQINIIDCFLEESERKNK